MPTTIKITELFGANLAKLLADKIKPIYPKFNDAKFIKAVRYSVKEKTYTQRIEVIADELHNFLPKNYSESIKILMGILGPENPNETGMFSNYYWIMPIGKYIEKYGLDDFDLSMYAIAEVTKRNTGEYAIRPFLRKYPREGLSQMKKWAKSDDFHLRRLASEGLRPKLPWASKLDEFIDNPKQVFEILELLKEENVKFVQKSVANHITDYLKVNPDPTRRLLKGWSQSKHPNTRWIVEYSTRKIQ